MTADIDLLNLPTVVFNKYLEAKENLIRKVMKQVLGREPEIEDAKDFQLITNMHRPETEIIAYKAEPLGRIYYIEGIEAGQYTIQCIFEGDNCQAPNSRLS